MDTQSIDHPLFKHIEYVNDENELAIKDTILPQADFFIRFQSNGTSNEIRISETINNVQFEKSVKIKN